MSKILSIRFKIVHVKGVFMVKDKLLIADYQQYAQSFFIILINKFQ